MHDQIFMDTRIVLFFSSMAKLFMNDFWTLKMRMLLILSHSHPHLKRILPYLFRQIYRDLLVFVYMPNAHMVSFLNLFPRYPFSSLLPCHMHNGSSSSIQSSGNFVNKGPNSLLENIRLMVQKSGQMFVVFPYGLVNLIPMI